MWINVLLYLYLDFNNGRENNKQSIDIPVSFKPCIHKYQIRNHTVMELYLFYTAILQYLYVKSKLSQVANMPIFCPVNHKCSSCD